MVKFDSTMLALAYKATEEGSATSVMEPSRPMTGRGPGRPGDRFRTASLNCSSLGFPHGRRRAEFGAGESGCTKCEFM